MRLLAIAPFILSAWTCAAQTAYLLGLEAGTDTAAVAARHQLRVVRTIQSSDETSAVLSAAEPLGAAALDNLRHEAGVRTVEAEQRTPSPETSGRFRAPVPLEPLGDVTAGRLPVSYFGALVRTDYVNQRAASIIRLREAQQLYPSGASVIAILDTGVDTTHPALQGVLLPGYDFTRDRVDTVSEFADVSQSTVAILDQSRSIPIDAKYIPVALSQSTVAILDQSTVAILDGSQLPKAFGHGTMVAGLVHLVSPTSRILPLKVFQSDGTAALSDIVQAIRYAADQGATVISMSFSLPASSPELKAAISYAASKGAICVASAGNDGSSHVVYPAGLKYVLGVGSTNYSDRRSAFSNYGDCARLAAPGEALITTYPGSNYAAVWGTSFSAGLVSGAVALLKNGRTSAGWDKIKDALDHGVAIDQEMGDARLDLMRSLSDLAH